MLTRLAATHGALASRAQLRSHAQLRRFPRHSLGHVLTSCGWAAISSELSNFWLNDSRWLAFEFVQVPSLFIRDVFERPRGMA